ncbi:MAG TPA: cupin domain-containing protein [Thermoanaerobaculia bacterium]|nr:cupin domain-containing protein [Thermoanaerobaculia bacterium]
MTGMMAGMTAEEVVRLLGLAPHPEGGFYRETFRAPAPAGERGASTAIYYLLPEGAVSAWHRVVDADEVWHHYAGAPLELTLWDGRERLGLLLGSDLAAGQRPQGVVPAGVWQTARTLGGWTLVGCTVAPGFVFASFEMAPQGWAPTPPRSPQAG